MSCSSTPARSLTIAKRVAYSFTIGAALSGDDDTRPPSAIRISKRRLIAPTAQGAQERCDVHGLRRHPISALPSVGAQSVGQPLGGVQSLGGERFIELDEVECIQTDGCFECRRQHSIGARKLRTDRRVALRRSSQASSPSNRHPPQHPRDGEAAPIGRPQLRSESVCEYE